MQAMSISLGVGSSTLAILNFFTAISDGQIDPAERRIMGVTYTVLRVAMVAILVSTLVLLGLDWTSTETFAFTGYVLAQITLVAVLFINAGLMTAKLMPSKFGPAIQASTWYSLGFILALLPHGLTDFGYLSFVLYYTGFMVLAIVFVNKIMSHIMSNKPKTN
jgi:hypothetical protein